MQPSAEQGLEPVPAGRILLIDDEQRVLRFVTKGLRAEGFVTDAADSGAEGLRKALAADWDLIILDMLMPDMDGDAVLRGVLAERPAQPVLVLSCLSATEAKVRCFEAGADDYLIKPFSLDELLARVRARLRAAARPTPVTLAAGRLHLDLVRRDARIGSTRAALAEREFLLLCELMRHAGQTVSKQRLLSAVWNYHFDPGSNVVDVYVRRLRAKLGADAIRTVRGQGYRVDAR